MRASNTLVLIMKNRRVSGRKLSEITGISRSAISQIVNGRLLPTDEELETICLALDVTPDQIYPIAEMRRVLQMTPEQMGDACGPTGIVQPTGSEPEERPGEEMLSPTDPCEVLKQEEDFESEGNGQ